MKVELRARFGAKGQMNVEKSNESWKKKFKFKIILGYKDIECPLILFQCKIFFHLWRKEVIEGIIIVKKLKIILYYIRLLKGL